MKTARTLPQLRKILLPYQGRGQIGFVPTMGGLHAGHLSLIRQAVGENKKVVVSIFVNPLQFNSAKDYQTYPKQEKQDLALCRQAGADVVYLPKAVEFYRKPFYTEVRVKELTNHLCGRTRPGHFEGVATVVLKLFEQVRPAKAYFGKKDFQQVRVIQQMVADLDIPVVIKACPTVREKSGLAMSSRNQLLTSDARERALVLNHMLNCARLWARQGMRDASALVNRMKKEISRKADKVDYVEIVGARDLQPLKRLQGEVLVAVAAFFDGVRLIDNTVIHLPQKGKR